MLNFLNLILRGMGNTVNHGLLCSSEQFKSQPCREDSGEAEWKDGKVLGMGAVLRWRGGRPEVLEVGTKVECWSSARSEGG